MLPIVEVSTIMIPESEVFLGVDDDVAGTIGVAYVQIPRKSLQTAEYDLNVYNFRVYCTQSSHKSYCTFQHI